MLRTGLVPFVLLLVLAVMAVSSAAQDATSLPPRPPAASPGFGAPGVPRFDAYYVPEDMASAHGAGEPSIGIPWNTDHSFFQAFAATHKAVFTDGELGAPASVSWSDVSPFFTITNLDPMLRADPVSGRIFAGGLAGPCSLMGVSDDDGATWLPALNMCSGAQFDHQSIGTGPWSTTAPESFLRTIVAPRAAYYCAQLTATACATSVDGGIAWLPFTEVLGGCGGLHGHIEVSEVTGMAAVPDASCASGEGALLPGSGRIGFGYTTDNGLTWGSRTMPNSETGSGFDPAVGFSRESGWLWLAQADDNGIHVALSKDEGVSWETLGGLTPGATPADWFDLNVTFTDPRTGEHLVYGAFTDIEAGDDARMAFTFLATTNAGAEHPFDDCSEESDGNVWHLYLTQTFDGGQTFTTTRLQEDPIQVGAIWNGGGSDPCRNLLDFQDMHVDSKGRVHVGLADGCTDTCAEDYFNWTLGRGPAPAGGDSRDSWGAIIRQTTGQGIFAAYDIEVPPGPLDTDGDGIANAQDDDLDGDGIPNNKDADVDGDGVKDADDDDVDGDGIPDAQDDDITVPGLKNGKKDTPGVGLVLLAAALAVAAVARRRDA